MKEKNATLKILVQAFSDRHVIAHASHDEFIHHLKQKGFSEENITRATEWIMQLMYQQITSEPQLFDSQGWRVFTAEEIAKLDVECRNFIMYLERIRFLEPQTREILINQLLLLDQESISLNDIKIVALLILLLHPSVQDKNKKIEQFASILNDKKPYITS